MSLRGKGRGLRWRAEGGGSSGRSRWCRRREHKSSQLSLCCADRYFMVIWTYRVLLYHQCSSTCFFVFECDESTTYREKNKRYNLIYIYIWGGLYIYLYIYLKRSHSSALSRLSFNIHLDWPVKEFFDMATDCTPPNFEKYALNSSPFRGNRVSMYETQDNRSTYCDSGLLNNTYMYIIWACRYFEKIYSVDAMFLSMTKARDHCLSFQIASSIFTRKTYL